MWQTIPADKNLRAGDWGWTEGKHFVNRVPQVENGSETSSANLLGIAEWQDCTGSRLRQGGNPRGSRLLWPRPQGGWSTRLHQEGVHRGRRGWCPSGFMPGLPAAKGWCVDGDGAGHSQHERNDWQTEAQPSSQGRDPGECWQGERHQRAGWNIKSNCGQKTFRTCSKLWRAGRSLLPELTFGGNTRQGDSVNQLKT